jgi:hypothetical protein
VLERIIDSSMLNRPEIKPVKNDKPVVEGAFRSAMFEAARSANIQVATGNQAGLAQFKPQREEQLEELFSFTEAEEELRDESLARIKHLLDSLQK